MINLNSIKNDIPLPIRLFLGKALLLFIGWKLLYGLVLFDSKVLDHPLTINVAESSTYVLNNLTTMSGFYTEREYFSDIFEGELVEIESSSIYHNDFKVLYIADVCNGLELIVLYIGFILCMPSSFWRKSRYIILGILIIHLVNILRCVGLIYLREYYQLYFEFAHKYLFKLMVYSATFVMWIVFSRKIHLKNETLQVG